MSKWEKRRILWRNLYANFLIQFTEKRYFIEGQKSIKVIQMSHL